MMKKYGMLMAAGCLFILQGCGKSDAFPSKKDASSQPKQHVTTEQLNYQDQDRWELESGDAQSPINIDTTKTVPMQDAGDIQLDYNTTVQDEEDNGHTIQVDDTGTAQINGRTFAFTQFHFHAPSEHTINGFLCPTPEKTCGSMSTEKYYLLKLSKDKLLKKRHHETRPVIYVKYWN
ncbi:carbonic anhydrase family protein [Bacillus paranthracis]